jgi:hypothetical protein
MTKTKLVEICKELVDDASFGNGYVDQTREAYDKLVDAARLFILNVNADEREESRKTWTKVVKTPE